MSWLRGGEDSCLSIEGWKCFWLYLCEKANSNKQSLAWEVHQSLLFSYKGMFYLSSGSLFYVFSRSAMMSISCLSPYHWNAGFFEGKWTRRTSPNDLKTLTISYNLLILVFTRAESSDLIRTLAASSKDKGPSENKKSLRKRAARFSSDFSFFPDNGASGPATLRWLIVATACESPRQT